MSNFTAIIYTQETGMISKEFDEFQVMGCNNSAFDDWCATQNQDVEKDGFLDIDEDCRGAIVHDRGYFVFYPGDKLKIFSNYCSWEEDYEFM